MILFFALLFVALAIAGFTAFVIFWPLTLVHVRDRHAAIAASFGAGAFLKPDRETRDPSLTGLATPARLSLLTIIAGLVCAGLLWLLSLVMA